MDGILHVFFTRLGTTCLPFVRRKAVSLHGVWGPYFQVDVLHCSSNSTCGRIIDRVTSDKSERRDGSMDKIQMVDKRIAFRNVLHEISTKAERSNWLSLEPNAIEIASFTWNNRQRYLYCVGLCNLVFCPDITGITYVILQLIEQYRYCTGIHPNIVRIAPVPLTYSSKISVSI